VIFPANPYIPLFEKWEIQLMTPKEALDRLLAGNRRFMENRSEHPRSNGRRRQELLDGQSPFAVILGCADSRVDPVLIFDQGLGDLFVIRVAGNIVDDSILGSIEYAVAHLGAPLVMVLGHDACGAVGAALAEEEEHCHIDDLVHAIEPAVQSARERSGDLYDRAIDANVERQVQLLRQSQPVLAPRIAAGTLQVVGARYGLDSGEVRVFEGL